MTHRRLLVILAAAVIVFSAIPTADAGGHFGLYVGRGGFGVSVGIGDWGVHTRSWADPHWTLNFNATLSGYGEWVWVGGIGRVWRPWVATDWRPYTHGRWVHTVHGWSWVAFEPWGYVPHHYGNWAYSSFGWVWVPGYSYVGANVVWVRSGGYIGWYARPPHGWSHHARDFRHGYRHGFRDGYDTGYRDGWHDASHASYVDWRHFGSDNVSHHVVGHSAASRSRIQDHAAVPSTAEIQSRGGGRMTAVPVSRRTINMGGREIVIARPEGVADSIERHAHDTVSRTLSPDAIRQRQPMVRSRASDSSADSGSRDVGVRKPQRQTDQRRPMTTGAITRGHEAPVTGSTSENRRSVSASRSIQSRSLTGSESADQDRQKPEMLRSDSPRSSVRNRPAARNQPQSSSQSSRNVGQSHLRSNQRGSASVESRRRSRVADQSQPETTRKPVRRTNTKPKEMKKPTDRSRSSQKESKAKPAPSAQRRR